MLKNRATDEPLFVVIFTLVPKDEAEASSSTEKKEVSKDATPAGGDDDLD